MEKQIAKNDVETNEYLIFRLGDEEFGIDILKVQEIRGCDRVTRLPNSPECIVGVTNLRGVIVPIIDLRIRFGLPLINNDSDNVVIVLNLEDRTVGIKVDGVSDVLSVTSAQIKPTPEITSVLSERHLRGLAVLDNRMIVLMNIEPLLNFDELNLSDDCEVV